MKTIDQRLSRLERRTKHRGVLLTAIGCVAATCLAGGAGQPESVPTVVRAQRFELVTANGQKVAEIAFNSDLDCGEITISSSDGTKRVRLTGEKAQRNGSVEIYGKSGVALGGLYADDNSACGTLGLMNAEGKTIHYVTGDKQGNGRSAVFNRLGKAIYRQDCTDQDAGWLTLYGAQGNALVRAGGASVVFHADRVLSSVALARRTLSRMSCTPAVQTKGFGSVLWVWMKASMASISR